MGYRGRDLGAGVLEPGRWMFSEAKNRGELV